MDYFKYLAPGIALAADGAGKRGVVHRVNEGYRAWATLKSVLSNSELGINVKNCLENE